MKIEIKTEKENPFMKRVELIVEIDHEGGSTPTKASIQKEIFTMKKVSPEHVDVRNVFSKRGIAKSEAKIFVWNEPKVKDLSKEAEKKSEGEASNEEQAESNSSETNTSSTGESKEGGE